MRVKSRTSAALLVSTVLAAALLSGCGSSSPKSDSTPSSTPSQTPSGSPTPSAKPGECLYQSDGQPPARNVTAPPAKPKYDSDVKVVFTTNLGKLPAVLDGKNAPCAVNAVTSLATQHYYNRTPCHRIAIVANGFHIIQCGDPSGTGTGGPGYAYAEEVKNTTTYPTGTIAMANTGQPNSTGSQFFIVFGKTQLGPNYTVLGQLTPEGLKTAKQIGKKLLKGKDKASYDGPPAVALTIEQVKVG